MPNDGIRSPFDKTYICPMPAQSASDWGGMGPTQTDEPTRQLGSLGGTQFADLKDTPAAGKFTPMKIPGSSR